MFSALSLSLPSRLPAPGPERTSNKNLLLPSASTSVSKRSGSMFTLVLEQEVTRPEASNNNPSFTERSNSNFNLLALLFSSTYFEHSEVNSSSIIVKM